MRARAAPRVRARIVTPTIPPDVPDLRRCTSATFHSPGTVGHSTELQPVRSPIYAVVPFRTHCPLESLTVPKPKNSPAHRAAHFCGLRRQNALSHGETINVSLPLTGPNPSFAHTSIAL